MGVPRLGAGDFPSTLPIFSPRATCTYMYGFMYLSTGIELNEIKSVKCFTNCSTVAGPLVCNLNVAFPVPMLLLVAIDTLLPRGPISSEKEKTKKCNKENLQTSLLNILKHFQRAFM